MNAVNFSVMAKLFGVYPTGMCVSYLEDDVALQVIQIGPEIPNYIFSRYMLLSPPNTPANTSNFATLSEFNPGDYPGVKWIFLRPDGSKEHISKVEAYSLDSINELLPVD